MIPSCVYIFCFIWPHFGHSSQSPMWEMPCFDRSIIQNSGVPGTLNTLSTLFMGTIFLVGSSSNLHTHGCTPTYFLWISHSNGDAHLGRDATVPLPFTCIVLGWRQKSQRYISKPGQIKSQLSVWKRGVRKCFVILGHFKSNTWWTSYCSIFTEFNLCSLNFGALTETLPTCYVKMTTVCWHRCFAN